MSLSEMIAEYVGVDHSPVETFLVVESLLLFGVDCYQSDTKNSNGHSTRYPRAEQPCSQEIPEYGTPGSGRGENHKTSPYPEEFKWFL